MRTTGVSGRLVRVAAVMVPMFGLLVLAQAPAPPQPAPPAAPPAAQPGPAARPGPWGGGGTLVVDDECRRGFLAQAAGPGAHAAGAGQVLHPAARLSPGARRRRTRRHQPGGHPVRWQRPDVCRRVHHLHARRRRQQPAPAREPHHALREHQGRRRLRQAHGLCRQARAAAHHRPARRQQHPDQRDRVGRHRSSTPTPTTTASPTSASTSTRASASAATATSSTSRPASTGASTTGSTRPTTPSASAGRRTASSRSRPVRTAGSGA